MLPEILLLLFSIEVLALLIYSQFLFWKINSDVITGTGAARRHAQYFLARLTAFMYIGCLFLIALFVIHSPA